MGLTVKHTFVSPKSEQSDPTIVGPNEWNATHTTVDTTGIFYNVDYIFTPIQPGVALTQHITNTITLPAGLGINATDVGHWLYVSGGTGTAEAVLITGGTYTPSLGGNITFTPNNNHSGAWTIQTATSGIQEALSVAPTASIIRIIGGTWNNYAPVTVSNRYQIIGAGIKLTVITLQSLTQDGFDITTPVDGGNPLPVIISDMAIYSTGTQNAGAMINFTGPTSNFDEEDEVHDVWMEGYFTGINLLNVAYFTIADCKFHSGSTTNNAIITANPANADAGDGVIRGNTFFGGGNAVTYKNGGGLRIFDNKFLQNQIGVYIPSDTAGLSQISINRNNFDGPVVYGIYMLNTVPASFITDWSISNNYFNNMPTGDFIRIDAGANFISRGVISANYFIQNSSGVGVAINLLNAVAVLAITGNEITTANNGTATVIHAGTGVTGAFVGNDINSFANAGYSVAASSLFFGNNSGINDVNGAVNSGTTLTFPIQPNFTIQGGAATVTTIIPPLATPGLRGTFIAAGGQTIGSGATIGQSGSISANKLYQWFWDGTKLWITGPGF